MTAPGGQVYKRTLEIVETAAGTLRLASAGTLAAYYIGSLPFILGFLYFQGDMSRNPFAGDHCAAASLALGGLFIWMKCWQAVFVLKVQTRLNHRSPPAWSVRTVLRLVAIQVIIQPSGLFILPLAATVLLPFGWVYAFYQNALTSGIDQPLRVRGLVTTAWRQAAWQPVQNHMLLMIYFLFGLFVVLNIGACMILIPLALKTFFDIDTRFSMSAASMFNTTFVCTTAGVAYLCLDPLIKISYLLRGFYGAALKTGADLVADLKAGSKPAARLVVAGLLVLCCLPRADLFAADKDPIPVGQQLELTAPGLDQAIETVMARREFTWRLPRAEAKPADTDMGFLTASLEWLARQIEAVAGLFTYMEKLINWLKKVLPEFDWGDDSPDDGGFSLDPRTLFSLFIVLLGLGFVVWALRKVLAARRAPVPEPADAPRARPDLTDETVQADQLPADQWLALAEEMAARGEYRLALRALYLCSLSHLGELRLISIAVHKSNFEYHRELVRRAHEKVELIDLFRHNLSLFEKAWYGRYHVNPEDVVHFRDRHERIIACAQ